jgi:hypothetical protein
MQYASSRMRKGLAIGSMIGLLLLLPVSAFNAERGHDLDNRRAVYSHRFSDWDGWAWGWGSGWGWGWGWGPYYYYPWWYHRSDTGKIKLEHVDGHDQVYINGAFTGKASDVKTLQLKPGRYLVEVRHDGKDVLKDQVYVTLDRTVKLDVGDRS